MSLASWKNSILNIVDRKINKLSKTVVPQRTYSPLHDPDVVKYLEDIHKRYVIVPIDKASNNVAIVCKRYYITVILGELGLTGNSTTYLKTDLSREEIINTNANLCKKLLNLELKLIIPKHITIF